MEILRRYGGPTAREDWDRLAEQLMAEEVASGGQRWQPTSMTGGLMVPIGMVWQQRLAGMAWRPTPQG